MKHLKRLLNWKISILKRFYYWIKSFFKTTYTIHVSYDSQWGNADDKVYQGVRSIQKQTFKELKFITEDKRPVHIKANSGLRYKIEVE